MTQGKSKSRPGSKDKKDKQNEKLKTWKRSNQSGINIFLKKERGNYYRQNGNYSRRPYIPRPQQPFPFQNFPPPREEDR